ncbi:hypothetical protein VPNG_09787 [Cytospora leucostoma]|uniref:Uncharacterized protein n=1 Tax=Cytospora leucostoma TaxID=1230097 RepID=A0A423VGI9_9PEZI|nr:hypothetical protein VPNG_09787 [Cytospora leucostoma]
MTFNVFDTAEYRAAFFVCILTTPLCILATALRFAHARTSKIGREDWLALVALLAYLTYTVMILWIIITMNGKSVFDAGTLPEDTVLAIFKVGYAMNVMFPINQTAAKLSLLALYYRLFTVNRTFVYWVYGITVTHIGWFLAMFWIRLFMCTPVSKVWAPSTPGHCINSNELMAVGEAFNSVLDFVMIGLAVWMVQSLQVSSKNRWKLSILFAIGGITGIIGFIKIGEAYGDIGTNVLIAVWIEVQMAVSIICCCAPIYRSIMPEIPLLRTLWSKTVGSIIRGRSNNKQKTNVGGSPSHLPPIRTFGQGSDRGNRHHGDLSNKTWTVESWRMLDSNSTATVHRSSIMTSTSNQLPTKEPAAPRQAINGIHHELRTAANSAGYLLGVLREKHGANPHLKLLDVGARSGTISATLAREIGPYGCVFATDSSPDMLQRARAVAEEAGVVNIEFQQAHVLDRLPFEDATFDITHCHQLLTHLPRPVDAVREMLRVTKPGGIVAAREGDLETECVWPELPGMLKFHAFSAKFIQLSGGTPKAGRQLLSWALAVGSGISRKQITPSYGTWCYYEPAEKKAWAQAMVHELRGGRLREVGLSAKLATEEDLEEMATAWEEWAENEQAILGMMHGEILIRKD